MSYELLIMNYKLPLIPHQQWGTLDALTLSGLGKVGGRIAWHTLMHHTATAYEQLLERDRQTILVGQFLTLIQYMNHLHQVGLRATPLQSFIHTVRQQFLHVVYHAQLIAHHNFFIVSSKHFYLVVSYEL
jgi:hypothetical protein